MNILKLFGDANARELARLSRIVEHIDEQESGLRAKTDEELKGAAALLRHDITAGHRSLDDALPDAFALVREAARRTLGQRHFGVQFMAGIVLHEGKIAEMKTGEGKTLAATAPAFLNALTGKGVHIVTVNDYLARRDAVWMGQIYHFLGLTVGCVTQAGSYRYDPDYRRAEAEIRDVDAARDTEGSFRVFEEFLRPVSKQEAYRADVVYATNSEVGFDYLRDNLAYEPSEVVHRSYAYAIVDEVDSILIDEARTPLIISLPDEHAGKLYKEFARLAPRLKEHVDFTIDEKMRAVSLTEEGMEKVEEMLGRNIYAENNLVLIHHVEEALRAHFLFKRDRDYVVKNGEVIIVDEFTGRLMPGRRYSGGLHQALEAKERVAVRQESRTVATITYQNFFKMYSKLAGMTGTAATSAEEFHKVYNLAVVAIPTNKPMVRRDLPDLVFRTERGKFQALVRDVEERHRRGQPVLIGTISIEKNELLSRLLARAGIRHEVLNAKQHEREGAIIAQAGRYGAVTVATNMAGRGVDIILGGNPPDPDEAERVRRAGGLHVIGTERHEARRIDNQLRGRSGRQGDPGSSQFYVSLEDDLMRVFGSSRVQTLMERLGISEDEPIQNPMVSRAIEAAQAKIEGFNFDLRKHVLEYDNVLSKQRDTIYQLRREILFGESPAIRAHLHKMARNVAGELSRMHTDGRAPDEWDFEAIRAFLAAALPEREEFKKDAEALKTHAAGGADALIEYVALALIEGIDRKAEPREEDFLRAARMLILRIIDMLWMDHLETMESLRDSVRLRAYGQRDPLIEYKREGHRLYRTLLANLDFHVVQWVLKAAYI
jgi:preprotein translocase subunit SecA